MLNTKALEIDFPIFNYKSSLYNLLILYFKEQKI